MYKEVIFLLIAIVLNISLVLAWDSSLETGLVSWFTFNETSGSTAFDEIGSYNGTHSGVTINQEGKIGKSYAFDSTDAVTFNGTPLPTSNNARAIAMWINASHLNALPLYRGGTNAGGQDFSTGVQNAIRFYVRRNGNDVTSGDTTFNTNEWLYLVISYDGTSSYNVKFWLNGQNISNAKAGSDVTFSTGTTNQQIGVNYLWTSFPASSTTYIDEIAIWNRSLNDSDVATLYNNGVGCTYKYCETVAGDTQSPEITLEYPLNNTLNNTNSTPEFKFNATDDTSTSLNCDLYLQNSTTTTLYGNNATTQNATSTTIIVNQSLINGDYKWWINCSDDALNSNISEIRNISIQLIYPIVTLVSPDNYFNSTQSEVNFECSATSQIDLINVTLYVDFLGTFQANETKSLSGTSDTETFSKILSDGTYIWNCYICDNNNDCQFADTNYTLNVTEMDWWDTSWKQRKKITIPNSKITADLYNFTIVVWLNNSNFDFSKAQSNGEDIRFLETSVSDELPYEIETWNSTDAYIWVRMSFINSSANTDFYMYYNNTGASNNENPDETWDEQYIMTHHFNDDPTGTLIDSASGSHNFSTTNFESADLIKGQIGNCIEAEPDGEYATSTTYDPDSLTEFTWVIWAYSHDNTTSANEQLLVYNKWDSSYGDRYIDHHTTTAQPPPNSPNYKFAVGTGYANASVTHLIYSPLDKNEWNLLVGTAVDGDNWYFYVDGVQVAINDSKLGFGDASTTIYFFRGYSTNYFNGSLDAFRYLNYEVTPDWVNTTYYSETFRLLSFGSEENIPALAPPVIQPSQYISCPDDDPTLLCNIMRGTGAGLGLFFIYLSRALPTLVLGILIVGIIVVIGMGIAKIFKYFKAKKE